MKRHFIYFLTLLLSSCLTALKAQEGAWTLRGRVLETNRTPLEFVNVYVNNTSIGTTTKEDGGFVLKIPKSVQKVEVVVSFIGYNSLKKILTPAELTRGVVFMLESSTLLKEVKVTAKRDRDWRKKWRIFKDGLLGQSQFANDCEILNPEAIRLEYDKNKNVVATASEPIFIENKGLGYKIMFQMDTFISDGKLTYFAGDKFFEKLNHRDEKQENKWNRFRRRAFNNSFRRFLVSLARNSTEQSGFEVFEQTKIRDGFYGRTSVGSEIREGAMLKVNADSICTYDSTSRRYTLHSVKPLMVFMTKYFNPVPVFRDYPYRFSQIALPTGSFEFTANGWITKPNGLLLRDFWGNEGFSSLLPDDYEEEIITDPNATPEMLAALYNETERKFTLINGKVTDQNGLAITDADVFVNHTENGVKTNAEGKFMIKVPVTLSQLELLVSGPKFLLAKETLNTKENTETLDIRLKADNFAVNNEKDKEFQRNWKVFEKILLGDPNALLSKTQFPESCVIQNPEVVRFEKDGSNRTIAMADKPLVILNNALGYKITYQLKHFETDGKESNISGDKYFEKLVAKDDKQKALWEKNQLKIYQESLPYFLVSLSRNQLEKNGFSVFKMARIQEVYDTYITVKSELADSSLIASKASDICRFDPESNRYYLHSEYPLLVFLTKRTEAVRLTFNDYPYKRSQIVLPNAFLEFAADGTVTNYQNAEMRDFWGNDGLSGSIPIDFSPEQGSLERINFDAVEIISSRKVTIDTTTRLTFNGMVMNREQLEVSQAKAFGMIDMDFNVKIYENDNNLTVFELLRRIPGLTVRFEQTSGLYFIGFNSSMRFQGGGQPVAVSLDGYLMDDLLLINTVLASVNVRDIENLGAIKYGTASIYGARGGNGIIVITTKK